MITPKLLKSKQLYIVVKICGFRKSQSTTSFFGGVVTAHDLMIVLHLIVMHLKRSNVYSSYIIKFIV